MKLLFAGNYREAKRYADEYKDEKFHIITDYYQCYGVERGTPIVLIGTYSRHPEYYRIIDLITQRNFQAEYK